MATAKAKTAPKKSAKAPIKTAAKKAATSKPKVKAKAPAKPKVVAKAPPVKKPVAVAPKVAKAPPQKAVPPKNESVFARLLREKAERHQQFLKQNENQHHTHDSNRMPHNHASFAKFAGPRRRAS